VSETAAERIPVEEGYFTIPRDRAEAPRLLATRCAACGEVLFPRREICAKCLSDRTEDTIIGPQGTLYTWTYTHVPLFGSMRAEAGGYGVGQVDLEDGPRVQAVLSGAPGDFAVGMPMELELETLRTDSEGREVVIFRFRPMTGGA
jgi:uncharacterized OB-fold protein